MIGNVGFEDEFGDLLTEDILIGEIVESQDEERGDLTQSFEVMYETRASIQRQRSAREIEMASGRRVMSYWRIYTSVLGWVIDNEEGEEVEDVQEDMNLRPGLLITTDMDFDGSNRGAPIYRILRVYSPFGQHFELDVEVVNDV